MKLIAFPNMIKAVIFDFDDTLTDNRTLDYHGFLIPMSKLRTSLPSEKIIRKFRMQNLLAEEIANSINLQNKKKFSISNFLALRKKFLQNNDSVSYMELKRDTEELLDFLKDENLRLYICSVKQNKNIIYNFLKLKNIPNYFENIYSSSDLRVNLDTLVYSNRVLIKTSLVNKLIKENDLKPKEIVFVGDSPEDMQAAQTMHTLFIYYDNSYQNKKIHFQVSKANSMLQLKKKMSSLLVEIL
jgi:phosphoglycolate phosphatase-like HAD superfamily hydrolase